MIVQLSWLGTKGSHEYQSPRRQPPDPLRDPFNQAMLWATDGEITRCVSHTEELVDYRQAMLAKWNGKVSGGCVLHP